MSRRRIPFQEALAICAKTLKDSEDARAEDYAREREPDPAAAERARILALLDDEAIVLDAVLNAQFDVVKSGGSKSRALLDAYRAALRAAIEKED